MGRAMLMVSVLMATIYAGIMVTMQRNILSVPNIVSRNMLTKQAESVSDYALRTAIHNSIQYGMMAGEGQVWLWEDHYQNFNIQDCTIDSIKYTFVGDGTTNSYRAISFVNGNLMGRNVHYRAEVAFSFPVIALLNLDYCIHLEMDQPQFNPGVGSTVWDSSENDNDAFFYGDVDTRPMGQGVDGWKCASFGGANGYIWHDGNSSMQVASEFTILSFAKIREGRTAATLVWMPPDPADPALASNGVGWGSVRKLPTGGIWLQSNVMYFSCTTVNGTAVTVTAPFVPDAKWPHNKDQWHFFGLTYNRGRVKAYIDGLPVGSNNNLLYPWYQPNAIVNKGIYLGREYFGTPQSGDAFRQMQGLLDQVGLVPRALSDGEIATFYNQTINPATIQYIRD